MKKIAVLTSVFLIVAPQIAQAEFYFGGKLGQSWLDDSCSVSSPCDDNSFGGGLYGGYNISDRFAVEAGYDVLGDFESNFNHLSQNYVVDGKLTALSIAPKYSVPIGSVDLFGKLGAAWIDYGDKNDVTLLAALGAEFGLTESLAARIEYQRINNITDDFISSLDVNSIFLGLTYTFGASEPMVLEAAEPVIQEELKPEPVVEPEPVPLKPEPVKQKKMFQEYGIELFDHDSFKLAANSEQYFDWLVGVMKKYPQAQAEIIGHTDSRGSAAYNQSLSENRAQAVAEYLYSQGISESRITVKGEGENRPKASNDTAEGRMANRRVEVVIDEFEYQE